MKKYSSITRVNSRRTSPIKKRIGAILIVGCIAALLVFIAPRLLAGVASVVAAPVQKTKTWLAESSGNLPLYFRDRQELIEENLSLQEKLAVWHGKEHSLELLERENDKLRSLLGEFGEKRVVAGIIGRPNALPYDVIVIDKGSTDGVILDAPVYIGDDRVIGIVQKVFADSAVVELITTPGFSTSVFVIGPDIYTTAVGLGGGQLRIGVPQGIPLAQGDPVVIPSVRSGIYGTISHIESLPTRPEQYGYVSTDIPLQSLRLVAVGSAPMRSVSFEEAQEIVAEQVDRYFTVPVPEGVLVVTGLASSSASTTDTEVSTTTNADMGTTSDSEEEL